MTPDRIRQLQSSAIVRSIESSRTVRGESGDCSMSYTVEFPDGVSLEEARAVSALLGAEVDIAAHRNAVCGGILSERIGAELTSQLRARYKVLLARVSGLVEEHEE